VTHSGRPSLGYFLVSRILVGVVWKVAIAIGSSGVSVLRGLPVERVWNDIVIDLVVFAAFGAVLGAWEYSTGRDLFPSLWRRLPSSRA